MPLFGFKTVHSGTQALVRDHSGHAKVVEGPARLTLWRSRVEPMVLHYAGEGQYLEVNQRAAPRLCLPGPVQMFLNPVEHQSIRVKEAIMVSANEALVVYSQNKEEDNNIYTKLGEGEKQGSFQRRVMYGPIRYVPQPNEWIHEFYWHGEDPSSKTRKIKGALHFTKLRVIADQMYFNVSDVRTKDDTQVTVKLMLFFQLVDIEKMLDSTHDPIGDFINGVASDTIQYVSGLTYEQFVEKTSKMNELETFSQLTARADMIGYRVNKVVFRGFHSSEALQEMHDKAIHERTRLRLEADTEAHRQKTLDLQLAKEEERGARERELEREKEQHRREMEGEEHKEGLRLEATATEHRAKEMELELVREGERGARRRQLEVEQAEHERRLEGARHGDKVGRERELGEMGVELERKKVEVGYEKVKVEGERLKTMDSLGVELSKVLVAECRNPDKVIRLENVGEGGGMIHLHEEDKRD